MAVSVITSSTAFSTYTPTTDILVWNDDDRTSGNHFMYYDNSYAYLYSVNGGTIYSGVNSGFWVMMYEGPISVKWFGATNLKTDNQAEIQLAINYAAIINSEVYLPKGLFNIQTSVVIKNGVKGFYGPGTLYFNASTISQWVECYRRYKRLYDFGENFCCLERSKQKFLILALNLLNIIKQSSI